MTTATNLLEQLANDYHRQQMDAADAARCKKDQEIAERAAAALAQFRAEFPADLAAAYNWSDPVVVDHRYPTVRVEVIVELTGIPTRIRWITTHTFSKADLKLAVVLDEDAEHITHIATVEVNPDHWQTPLAHTLCNYAPTARQLMDAHAVAQQKHRHNLDLAQRLIDLATAWTVLEDAYNSQCRHWATRIQSMYWQPWCAWQIRYVPSFPGCANLPDDSDLIHNVLAEPSYTFNPNIRYLPYYKIINTNGRIDTMVLGAILDAQHIPFAADPGIEHPQPHHHQIKAGPYTVNLPPHTAAIADEVAAMPARAHPTFLSYLEEQLSMSLEEAGIAHLFSPYGYDYTATSIVQMNAEALADRL